MSKNAYRWLGLALGTVFLFSGCASSAYKPSGFLDHYETMTEESFGLTTQVKPGVLFKNYDSVVIAPADFSRLTGKVKEKDKTETAEWFRTHMRAEMLNTYAHVAEDEAGLPKTGKSLRIEITVTMLDFRKGPAFEGRISDVQTGEVLASFMHKEKTILMAKDIKGIEAAMSFKTLMNPCAISFAAAAAWAGRISQLMDAHWDEQPQEPYGYVASYFSLDDQLTKMPEKLPPFKEWRAHASFDGEWGTGIEILDMPFPEGYCLWKLKAGRYKSPTFSLLVFPEIHFSFTEVQPPLWATLNLPTFKQTLHVKPGSVIYLGHMKYRLGPPPKATNPVLKKISEFGEKMGGVSDYITPSATLENRSEDMIKYLKEKLPGQKYRLIEQLYPEEPKRVA